MKFLSVSAAAWLGPKSLNEVSLPNNKITSINIVFFMLVSLCHRIMFLVQLYETTMSKTKELAADLLKNVDVVKGLVKQQVQTVMDKMVYLR